LRHGRRPAERPLAAASRGAVPAGGPGPRPRRPGLGRPPDAAAAGGAWGGLMRETFFPSSLTGEGGAKRRMTGAAAEAMVPAATPSPTLPTRGRVPFGGLGRTVPRTRSDASPLVGEAGRGVEP